jgi:5-methylcytosine-specific restriction endonuclease McrA
MTDEQLMKTSERLELAGIRLSDAELAKFCAAPDTLEPTGTPPKGYKKCNKCGRILKITSFNKNVMAKDGCTSQCKDCQKVNARKSYAKNKHKRTYKKYYERHKEEKREQSRNYYREHKEELAIKHAKYRSTAKGRKVMNKAHAKRAKSLKDNTGIPYTREMVIERDKQGGEYPICYLCGKPITTGTIHLDHVIPVVMGGRDCFTNIACVHDVCNLSKSKDAREITEVQLDTLMKLSDAYMDQHKELFPEIFGEATSDADEAKN